MQERENFGSRAAVILTMAGSAIGLGNIWRFPYLVGQNGGAAFVIIYIVFTLLLSLPIFLAESAIGRNGGTDCRSAIALWVPGRAGRWLGMLSVITPLWIASYYSVVGGWSLEYLFQALLFKFSTTEPALMAGNFEEVISHPFLPIAFHLLFLAATVVVVVFGIKGGIERFSKICIPLLFLLILVITVYSLSLPGASKGVSYLVRPDFSKVTIHTFIDALGQSFFSLSLGMGIIITYSSFVNKKENLMAAGLGTSVSDLLFAYLAGFAVMPAVFAAGMEPSSGAGLVFDTLPYIFSQMAVHMPIFSAVAAILFFLAIFIAAITSSVSLIEVGVDYLTTTRKMKRGWACALLFGICGVAGILCSLSFGPLSHIKIMGLSIFDFADNMASDVLLMLGSLIAVIIAGWVMPKKILFRELTNGGSKHRNVKVFPVVYILLRYVAPIGILVLILSSLL